MQKARERNPFLYVGLMYIPVCFQIKIKLFVFHQNRTTNQRLTGCRHAGHISLSDVDQLMDMVETPTPGDSEISCVSVPKDN